MKPITFDPPKVSTPIDAIGYDACVGIQRANSKYFVAQVGQNQFQIIAKSDDHSAPNRLNDSYDKLPLRETLKNYVLHNPQAQCFVFPSCKELFAWLAE